MISIIATALACCNAILVIITLICVLRVFRYFHTKTFSGCAKGMAENGGHRSKYPHRQKRKW